MRYVLLFIVIVIANNLNADEERCEEDILYWTLPQLKDISDCEKISFCKIVKNKNLLNIFMIYNIHN